MKQTPPTTVTAAVKPTKTIGLAEVKNSLPLAIANKLAQIKELHTNTETPKSNLAIFRCAL